MSIARYYYPADGEELDINKMNRELDHMAEQVNLLAETVEGRRNIRFYNHKGPKHKDRHQCTNIAATNGTNTFSMWSYPHYNSEAVAAVYGDFITLNGADIVNDGAFAEYAFDAGCQAVVAGAKAVELQVSVIVWASMPLANPQTSGASVSNMIIIREYDGQNVALGAGYGMAPGAPPVGTARTLVGSAGANAYWNDLGVIRVRLFPFSGPKLYVRMGTGAHAGGGANTDCAMALRVTGWAT